MTRDQIDIKLAEIRRKLNSDYLGPRERRNLQRRLVTLSRARNNPTPRDRVMFGAPGLVPVHKRRELELRTIFNDIQKLIEEDTFK